MRVLIIWRPDADPEPVMQLAAWLTRTTDTTVRVVSIFRRPWGANLVKKYDHWLKRQARKCRDRTAEALSAFGVPETSWDETFSVVLDGPTEAPLIARAAEDFHADLILTDATSRTAEALLHSSPRPLGLAPHAAKLSPKGVRRVNFAFLDREQTEDAPSLKFAAKLAASWSVPLRILAFSPTGITDRALARDIDLDQALASEWREHSLALLDRAVKRIGDGIEVSSAIATGDGWGGAVDALKWKKGDLLCLGSNPVGPIERVFVGSDTNDFLPHVHVPVIVDPVRK